MPKAMCMIHDYSPRSHARRGNAACDALRRACVKRLTAEVGTRKSVLRGLGALFGWNLLRDAGGDCSVLAHRLAVGSEHGREHGRVGVERNQIHVAVAEHELNSAG